MKRPTPNAPDAAAPVSDPPNYDAPDHDTSVADPQLAGENNPAFDPRTGREGPNPGAPEPIARRMGRDRVVEPGRRGRGPSVKP